MTPRPKQLNRDRFSLNSGVGGVVDVDIKFFPNKTEFSNFPHSILFQKPNFERLFFHSVFPLKKLLSARARTQ